MGLSDRPNGPPPALKRWLLLLRLSSPPFAAATALPVRVHVDGVSQSSSSFNRPNHTDHQPPSRTLTCDMLHTIQSIIQSSYRSIDPSYVATTIASIASVPRTHSIPVRRRRRPADQPIGRRHPHHPINPSKPRTNPSFTHPQPSTHRLGLMPPSCFNPAHEHFVGRIAPQEQHAPPSKRPTINPRCPQI